MNQAQEALTTLPKLATVVEAYGLFADAAVADEKGNLFFVSLWGRDTVIQEFLAKLTLSPKEGGIRSFSLKSDDFNTRYGIQNVDALKKQTSRTAANTVLGSLAQLWLYQEVLEKPELMAGRSALLHVHTETDPIENRLWNLLRRTSKIPLLPDWKNRVLEICKSQDWIRFHKGFGVDMYLIELPDSEFEDSIATEIRRGRLIIPDDVITEMRK